MNMDSNQDMISCAFKAGIDFGINQAKWQFLETNLYLWRWSSVLALDGGMIFAIASTREIALEKIFSGMIFYERRKKVLEEIKTKAPDQIPICGDKLTVVDWTIGNVPYTRKI